MDEGTIVHIDYDLFNADSEKLIETTREDVAKEHDAHDENRTYSPMVTVVGDGRLIPGFEAHLAEAEAETDYSSTSSHQKPTGSATRASWRPSPRLS